MELKIKKTSEVVDAFLCLNKDGKLVATYWTKGTNQGQGGWVTTKIKDLVPLDVETQNEKHSKECQAVVDERDQMYADMFDDIDNKEGIVNISLLKKNIIKAIYSEKQHELNGMYNSSLERCIAEEKMEYRNDLIDDIIDIVKREFERVGE